MSSENDIIKTINKIERDVKIGSGTIIRSPSLKERIRTKLKTAVLTGMMVAGIFVAASQKLSAQEHNTKVSTEQTTQTINTQEEKKEINIIIKTSKLYSQLVTDRSISKEEREAEINKLSEFISKHFEVFLEEIKILINKKAYYSALERSDYLITLLKNLKEFELVREVEILSSQIKSLQESKSKDMEQIRNLINHNNKTGSVTIQKISGVEYFTVTTSSKELNIAKDKANMYLQQKGIDISGYKISKKEGTYLVTAFAQLKN